MANLAEKLASLLHKIPGEGNPEGRFISAVIAAGGCGSRMKAQNGETKQLMCLLGKPVIAHTIEAFQNTSCVREIIVAVRAGEEDAYRAMETEYGWKKPLRLVPGGETRQQSVLAGFLAISDESEYVLIHDGARCLVTPSMIEKVARETIRYRAACAAERASSTVKREDGKEMIAETLDRDTIWLAQTPQGFDVNLYRASVYTAPEGFQATDDCMFAEQAHFPIRLVDCGAENRKITTPVDLCIAEAILRAREVQA